MGCGQSFHAFGSGDQTHVLDPTHAPALENIDRRHSGAPGGQHGVQNNADIDRRFRGQFVVILDRAQRLFIAIETDVPNLNAGQQLHDTVDQAKAGAQYGHKADGLAATATVGDAQRRFNFSLRQVQVPRDFIGNQKRQFAHEFTEGPMVGLHGAKLRQFVDGERMTGNVQPGHGTALPCACG